MYDAFDMVGIGSCRWHNEITLTSKIRHMNTLANRFIRVMPRV